MSDINLLPEEIRRREEKERQKPFRPSQMPMSTPILDEETAKHSLIIRAPKSPAAPPGEEHVKHLREESYIRIDKEGKIIRETMAPTKSADRIPWWQWFFRPRLKVERVNVSTPKPSPVPPAGPADSAKKIISTETVKLPPPTPKPARLPWWQWFFRPRLKVQKVSVAPAKSAAPPPRPAVSPVHPEISQISTPTPKPARLPWWQWFFRPRVRVEKVTVATFKPTPAPPPKPPETAPGHDISRPSIPTPKPVRRHWWQWFFRPRVKIKKIQVGGTTSAAKPPPPPSPIPEVTIKTKPSIPPSPTREGGAAVIKSAPVSPSSAEPARAQVMTPEPAKAKGRRAMNEPDILGGQLGPPLGINLIPRDWVERAKLAPNLRLQILIILAGLCILSLLGSLGIRTWYLNKQQSRYEILRESKNLVDKQTATLADKERQWRELRYRLLAIKYLLDNHVDILPAFRTIEESIIPEARLTSINLTSSGTIRVAGLTNSYEQLARQVKAFEAMPIQPSKVDLADYAFNQGSREMTFGITIDIPASHLIYAYK